MSTFIYSMWRRNRFLNFISVHKYLILLLLLFTFHAVNNCIVIGKDNVPFIYDQMSHYEQAFNIYQNLFRLNLNLGAKLNLIFAHTNFYPFLRFWLTAPFFFLFGASPKSALASNLLYLFILIYTVYGIGSILKDKLTGFMASFLISFYPCVFGFSRAYMLDFPVAALVSLAIYLMFRTNYFRNRKYILLLGLNISVGLLHKQTFLIYFSGPFLIYSLQAIDKSKKRVLSSIAYLLIIPLVLALPWYLHNFLKQICLFKLGNVFVKSNIVNSLIAFSYLNLKNYQLYPVLTYFFYFCLFMYLKEKTWHKFILIIWLGLPLLFFTLYTPEDFPRHSLPGIIASGIIISYTLNSLPQYINFGGRKIIKLSKQYIFSCISAFLLIQFFFINYRNNKLNFTTEDFNERLHFTGILYPVKFEYKDTEKIINLIKDDAEKDKKVILGIGLPDVLEELVRFQVIVQSSSIIGITEIFNSFILNMDTQEKPGISFNPEYFDYLLLTEPMDNFAASILLYDKFRKYKFRYRFYEFYYMLLKESSASVSLEQAKYLFHNLAEDIQDKKDIFRLLDEFELPSSVFKERYPKKYYLYKRINL